MKKYKFYLLSFLTIIVFLPLPAHAFVSMLSPGGFAILVIIKLFPYILVTLALISIIYAAISTSTLCRDNPEIKWLPQFGKKFGKIFIIFVGIYMVIRAITYLITLIT